MKKNMTILNIVMLSTAFACLQGRNNIESTLLHKAIMHDNDPKTIAFLLHSGADINAQNAHGWTPLDIALQRDGYFHTNHLAYAKNYKLATNNEKTIDLLLQSSAVSYDGTISLHVAIENNCSPSTIEKLINHGAFINQINHAWQTPLVVAVMHDLQELCQKENPVSNLETIRVLLQNGANPYSTTTDGKTALQMINTILDIINKNWIMSRYDYERYWEQLVYVTQDMTRIYVHYKNSIHIYNELVALKNLLQQYS